MDLHVRYMLGGHLLMIWNDCLDLLVPKEAQTTFVHNMLIKQFFCHNATTSKDLFFGALPPSTGSLCVHLCPFAGGVLP